MTTDTFLFIALALGTGALFLGVREAWPWVEMGAGLAVLPITAVLAFRAILRALEYRNGLTSRPARRRLSIRRILLGPPLPTHEMPHETVGKFVGLAVFASDVLSSVAYATEEMLIILALAGVATFGLSIPISIAISSLLIVLTISYRQNDLASSSRLGRSRS